jgi:hypothetical protein
MAIDKAVRDSIIVAAITGAGPVGPDAELWEADVLRGARRITAILSDETNIFGKAIDEIDTSSKFIALISLVRKEPSSTRGVVYFQNIPKGERGQYPAPLFTYDQITAVHAIQAAARKAGQKPPDLPEGLETIRTQRTDTSDGLLLAKEASSLIGHRVVIFKINEPIGDGKRNVRVVRHLTDLGAYEGYALPAPAVAAAPAAVAA